MPSKTDDRWHGRGVFWLLPLAACGVLASCVGGPPSRPVTPAPVDLILTGARVFTALVGVLFVAAAALPAIAGLGAISAACSASLLLLALFISAFVYARAHWARSLARAGIFLATPLALVLLTIFVLIEQGETVILRTFDRDGLVEETRLWVVDFDGSPWLGAGGGETRRWYKRLQAIPEVEVERRGIAECFRAEPEFDPVVRDAVIELTRKKYRLGNAGLSIGNNLGIPMRENSLAIPVRLISCDPELSVRLPARGRAAHLDSPAV